MIVNVYVSDTLIETQKLANILADDGHIVKVALRKNNKGVYDEAYLLLHSKTVNGKNVNWYRRSIVWNSLYANLGEIGRLVDLYDYKKLLKKDFGYWFGCWSENTDLSEFILLDDVMESLKNTLNESFHEIKKYIKLNGGYGYFEYRL